METIQFDTIGASNVRKTLKTSVTELDGYIKEIENNLNSISTAWSGVDAVKFLSKLSTDYKKDLGNIRDSLNSFADYLNVVNEKYSELDRINAEEFSKIEV